MTPAQVSGELASALETLYRHPEIRRQMGRAASRRARKLYLWDVFAERLLHIYEDVLGPEAEGHAASPFPPASHAERLPGHAL